jgi:hypothetical protein
VSWWCTAVDVVEPNYLFLLLALAARSLSAAPHIIASWHRGGRCRDVLRLRKAAAPSAAAVVGPAPHIHPLPRPLRAQAAVQGLHVLLLHPMPSAFHYRRISLMIGRADPSTH